MHHTSRQTLYRQRLQILTIAGGAVLSAACSDASGPTGLVKIVPAASVVALQSTPQGRVLNTTVTVTNMSSYTLSYSSCGVTLEQGGMPALPPGKSEWETVWTRACYLLQANPTFASSAAADPFLELIPPRGSVTIPITAFVGQPAGFTGQPGQYRFRVPMYVRMLGTYQSIEDDQSVSDPFFLEPAA